MKYCIHYYKGCDCINEVNEITIKYSKGTQLIDFLNEHKQQRVNIFIDNLTNFTDMDFDIVAAAAGSGSYNAVVLVPYDQSIISRCRSHNIPFFINEHCSTWEKVHEHLNYGVSDIYIVEGLLFELDRLAPIIHEANAAIRAFPNIAQSAPGYNPKLWSQAFIRPEDIAAYEPYIDTFEFMGEISKQAIFYDVYAKQGHWSADLNLLIKNLNFSIKNVSLNPSFPEKRISCGRDCIRGGRCRRCKDYITFANVLHNNDIIIKKKDK